MAPSSKRARMTRVPTVTPDGADLGSDMSSPAQTFVPFQTGPSLERIPDDVLLEILSHVPTLEDLSAMDRYVFVRAPTLRTLSRTSRILRSRCLAMAWRSVDFCGVSFSKHNASVLYRQFGEATLTTARVLKESPHLVPLIQTVSVIMTRYKVAEIIPTLAGCLATLPNLTTIQVIYAHSQMSSAIKLAFQDKLFPSVRRISLPSSAHEIIRCCPNLEQVTCLKGDGSTIIGSLIKGKCQQVRILKGISFSLTRLVKLLPGLGHIGVEIGVPWHLGGLTDFTLLDTIEVDIRYWHSQKDIPLSEIAATDIKRASEILKNKSQAEKTVIVTRWADEWDHARFEFDANKEFTIRETVRV